MAFNFWGLEWHELAALIAPIGGLIIISLQLRQNNVIAKGNFISALAEDIDALTDTETRLMQGGDLYEFKEELTQQDYNELIQFLNFFMRVYHLWRLSLLNMNTINNMFAYRFFILVRNPNVKRYILDKEDQSGFWDGIEELDRAWTQFREAKGLDFPATASLQSM